jgi:Peptidase family M28
MSLLSQQQLRELVTELAAISRASASPGERRAAQDIAREMETLTDRVALESERAHGTYWWPLGLLTGAAALAGLSGRRLLALAVGAVGAAGVRDDITGGSLWFRRVLPQRETVNVVAEFGPPDADTTVLFIAHHDAAHSGLVFHPGLPRAIGRRFPDQLERTNTTPPTMWAAFIGPLLIALGALLGGRRGRSRAGRALSGAGVALSAGHAAAMVDIGLRPVVPGANDNLTGVAVLLSLAHALHADPPALRVILLSTGSEESFMEGMQAFGRRHFGELERRTTRVVCLDTVGSPRLTLLEGEGMLGIRDYDEELKALIDECAQSEGLELVRDLRFRNATDALIAMKAGFPSAMLGSVDEFKIPSNYHWPTDTAENVDYASVADAARLCWRVLARVGEPAKARA